MTIKKNENEKKCFAKHGTKYQITHSDDDESTPTIAAQQESRARRKGMRKECIGSETQLASCGVMSYVLVLANTSECLPMQCLELVLSGNSCTNREIAITWC